jgi:para-nitrobenzyl esterase
VRANGVDSFLGIPFAAPPTGRRRGQPPQPAEAWQGVRRAAEFGDWSLQPFFPAMPTHATETSSEDCLYLNVWAPVGAVDRPVLVIVHGGGFQIGSGAAMAYRGDRLAASGIVVVTFNYRLGALGFDHGPLWIQDQIAALEWVQRNIQTFGGDPRRVTLAGMSAGGVSVNALNLSPEANGLFDQAIVISGGGDSLFSPAPHPTPQSIDHNAPTPVRTPAFDGGRGETPYVDGAFVDRLPSQALAAGVSNASRLVVGYSTFEGSLLDTLGLPADLLAQVFASPENSPSADGYDLYGELVFRRPARELALLSAGHAAETWLFDFGYVPQNLRGKARGAGHGAALYALLGTLNPAYAELGATPTDPDWRIAAGFRDRILAFIEGGEPNLPDKITWTPLMASAPLALTIGDDGRERMEQPRDLADSA